MVMVQREAGMRAHTSLISFLAAGTVMGLALAAGTAAPMLRLADRSATAIPVDTELVIAVDVSFDMDFEEQELQREGYITGLTSREFMSAVRQGSRGKVAVTYFEWAGRYDQKIIMPWRLIDGPESANAVANEIQRAPYRRAPRTSIFGALQFAKPLFDASGYNGLRRVIDVSGNGINNMGPRVATIRDDVLGAGITINGLPIMLKRRSGYGVWEQGFESLDIYYKDCVTGGPGSFVIPIKEREQFKEATRHKLVLEIAGRTPERRVIPAQTRTQREFCN